MKLLCCGECNRSGTKASLHPWNSAGDNADISVSQTLALSDLDALRFIQGSSESVDLLHSICAQCPRTTSRKAQIAGAEGLALNKAFLEEVRAAQASFEVDPTTSTRALREEYGAFQFQLSNLAKSELDPASRESKRRDLQSRLSQIEHQLSERSGILAQTLRDQNLALKDIVRNFTPQAALADFAEYPTLRFHCQRHQPVEGGTLRGLPDFSAGTGFDQRRRGAAGPGRGHAYQ